MLTNLLFEMNHIGTAFYLEKKPIVVHQFVMIVDKSDLWIKSFVVTSGTLWGQFRGRGRPDRHPGACPSPARCPRTLLSAKIGRGRRRCLGRRQGRPGRPGGREKHPRPRPDVTTDSPAGHGLVLVLKVSQKSPQKSFFVVAPTKSAPNIICAFLKKQWFYAMCQYSKESE